MIFVTVGTQLPFDRLIQALDQWVASRDDRPEVFAQIGPEGSEPQNIEFVRTISPEQFAEKLQQAQVVIAHAGMGTILSALEIGKKVLVLPRRADLGEHRNDHQLATAKKLGEAGMVEVAEDETQLMAMLDRLEQNASTPAISHYASEPLIDAVRQFIFQGRTADADTKNSDQTIPANATKATHA